MADSDEEVFESNENNNSHTAELSLADLEITNVSYSPTSPSVGDDVTWTVTVENNGPGNATAFSVAFDDDDQPSNGAIVSERINSLAVDAAYTVTFAYTAVPGESYWFTADMDGEVTEANENNNTDISIIPVYQVLPSTNIQVPNGPNWFDLELYAPAGVSPATWAVRNTQNCSWLKWPYHTIHPTPMARWMVVRSHTLADKPPSTLMAVSLAQ